MTGATLLGLMSGMAFGLSSVIVKSALQRVSVTAAMMWNLFICTVVFSTVWVVQWLLGGVTFPPLDAIGIYALSGVFSFTLGRTTMFFAVRHMGASRASAFRVASPITTIALAAFFFGERVGWAQAVGIAAIIAGLIAISLEVAQMREAGRQTGLDQEQEGRAVLAATGETDNRGTGVSAAGSAENPRGKGPLSLASLGLDWKGLALGAGIAASFGIGDVFRKAGMVRHDDAVAGALFASLSALLLYCVYAAVQGQLFEPFRVERPARLSLIGSGLSVAVAGLTFFLSVRLLPVSVVTPLAGTQSLFAILFSYLSDRAGEYITWKLWLSSAAVVAGVALLVGT